MTKWVTLSHPDIEGTQVTTEAAAKMKAKKGWVVVDDDAGEVAKVDEGEPRTIAKPALKKKSKDEKSE